MAALDEIPVPEIQERTKLERIEDYFAYHFLNPNANSKPEYIANISILFLSNLLAVLIFWMLF